LGAEGTAEVWVSHDPVVYGAFGPIRFAANEHILFGGLHLREQEHETLELAAYRAYRSVLELLRDRGYSYPLRMWNYFPGINEEFLGLERYQRFCLGRHQAFAEHRYTFDGDLPAASAIGIPGEGLWVYFLAAREPGVHIENPRQISAYRYPLRYGPRSPSFSRATLTDFSGERQLYLSGTASIVGHETRHRDDAAAQLRETLANIEAILDHPAVNARPGLKQLNGPSLLKVYVRDPADFDLVSGMLAKAVGAECPILYLHGDVCRRDLMLEIEGVIRLAR
jgi:chorismate lyase/3-hydroxybenzoate synthase